MKPLFLLGFLALVSGQALAYEGKTFALAVGAKLANDVVRRGARLYDGVQASPVLYVGLFDHRIQFFVNSLELTDFVYADVLRARTKIQYVSDRPFLKTAGDLTARNQRETSWEWISRLEWFFPSINDHRAQLDLSYAKDVKAHAGHYLEATARVTVARLMPDLNGKSMLQPQLFATLGWGDGRHNQYLYGTATRASGFNHVAYGVMILALARIDPHYPIIQLYRYDVLGDANRAGLLTPQTHGYHLDITIAFGIL